MKRKTKLLIPEPPIQVLPKLAKEVGLNEAIVLQQLHYWLENPKAGKMVEGHKWIFNTYKEWNENFPFWSVTTIQRIFSNLEKLGYVISGQFDKQGWDMRKYYRLNYDAVGVMEDAIMAHSVTPQSDDVNRNAETSPENTPHAKELSKEELEQANAKVTAMLSQGKGPSYQNREKFPEPLQPFADLYFQLTGQEPVKRVLHDWIAVFSEWQSEGFTVEHIKAAHAKAKDFPSGVLRPGTLTNAAAAAKGKARQNDTSRPDPELERLRAEAKQTWAPPPPRKK